MKYPSIISIGIAARNEEKTITEMLLSVIESTTQIPSTTEVEIITGVSASTDDTENVIANFVARYNHKPRPITFRTIKPPRGLIAAQRCLFAAKKSKDGMLFFDADTRVDKDCVVNLLQTLQRNAQANITWALMIPGDHKKPSFKHLVYNFVDYYPQVVVRGLHVCGRAFMIHKYSVPFISKQVDKASIDRRLWNFLHLADGPLVDDAYLSRAALTDHGPSSLARPEGAIIYFQPIGGISDFYYSQRRKEYEGHRLDALFPEYSNTRKKHFWKKLNREAYAKLSFKLKLACRLYLFLYAFLWKISAYEYRYKTYRLRRGAKVEPATVWPSLSTTKQGFQQPTDKTKV